MDARLRLFAVVSVLILSICAMGSAIAIGSDESDAESYTVTPGETWTKTGAGGYYELYSSTLSSSYYSVSLGGESGWIKITFKSTCPTGSYKFVIIDYDYDSGEEVYRHNITITVKSASTPVTSITISGSSSVTKGSSLTLTATTSPTSATDRHVTWSVQSGSSYVSITSTSDTTTGGRCVIKGVAAGTAVIKATAADGSGVTKTKTITVSNPSYNYNLYYDANGGSGEPSTQTKTSTSTSSTLSFTVSSTEPMRSGYTFLGWSTSSTATSASYTGGDTVRVTYDDLTLYAVWEKITYTCKLQYNANGGSGAPTTQTYTGSSTSSHSFTVSSTVPVCDGYTFLGWSTSSTATSASHTGGDSISVSYNGTTTLYAVWEENEPVISWTTAPSQDCIKLPTIVYADDGSYIIQGASS